MDSWLEKNYYKLRQICNSVTKLNDVDELLHFCIEIVIRNRKFQEIDDDKGKLYYFTRVVLNNWKSKSSPFYKTYRQYIPPSSDSDPVFVQIENDEIDIDLEWVENELKQIKKENWYYARLFELYIEENCSLTKLSVRTTIPVNSLSRDIKVVRQILQRKRKNILYGL